MAAVQLQVQPLRYRALLLSRTVHMIHSPCTCLPLKDHDLLHSGTYDMDLTS
jgi:hypothetical protein